MNVPIVITKGRDTGKLANIIKYIGDEAWRCVLVSNGVRTVIYEGQYIKL